MDEVERELTVGQMMICDESGPIGVAGVMGGLATEADPGTKRVFLEAAHFNNRSVRKTRKQLGLNTEASYRFERSVDPEGVVRSLNRVAGLLDEFSGGSVKDMGLTDIYPRKPVAPEIKLTTHFATSRLGMKVTPEEMQRYLSQLGFAVELAVETLTVTPPSWRPDVLRAEDVVEEIGRAHGYDRIPETLPVGAAVQGGFRPEFRRLEDVRSRLLRSGAIQVLNHTLCDKHALDSSLERVGPRQPAGPDTTYLRNSLLPGLAETFKRNGGKDLVLFEIGKVFSSAGSLYIEERKVGLCAHGAITPASRPKEVVPPFDFSGLKAIVEGLGLNLKFGPAGGDPRFHMTRSATLYFGEEEVGILGQIHPKVAAAAGLPSDWLAAEISVTEAVLKAAQTAIYQPISRNPSIRRDVTVAIATSFPYLQLEQAVRGAAGEVLEKLWLVDVYSGAGVEAGLHAVTLGLQLRKAGENFTDEEANQVRDAAVSALVKLGAQPR